MLLQQEQQQLKDQQQKQHHQQQQQPSEEEEESQQQQQSSSSSSSSSPEETASQLTEGTLRALRDLALDEAVELHLSLRYWSDRWERPIYSWFIAGPFCLFGKSPGSYDHTRIGRKVSQIQAVLARRLSSIGELQQHILRSGWQRGVASWGFLGEGGDWAEVAGTDGRMSSSNTNANTNTNRDDDDEKYNATSPIPSRNQSRHRYRPPLQRELSIGSVGLHLDELHNNNSTNTLSLIHI